MNRGPLTCNVIGSPLLTVAIRNDWVASRDYIRDSPLDAARDAGLGARPRHQNNEFEAVLKDMELRGWIVTKGKGYFIATCPPPHARCFKTVELTPSDPSYLRNLRGWLRRSECWKEKP